MTMNVANFRKSSVHDDWRDLDPVSSTGASADVNGEKWVEVFAPSNAKRWIKLADIHTTGFDTDLIEGRYLYVGHYFSMAVALTGLHVSIMGKKYYILTNGTESRFGELNNQTVYTMAPAEYCFKISEIN
jgi:hypothetical protein